MTALITGPSNTPYSNGCFLFDIFFPKDYPNVPPNVWLRVSCNPVTCSAVSNLRIRPLATAAFDSTRTCTIRAKVRRATDRRFDANEVIATVCLSLLGTWSGAEGENWNKDTSTLLQVLVSVQSLILVPEPYFNEPGTDIKPFNFHLTNRYYQATSEQCTRLKVADKIVRTTRTFSSRRSGGRWSISCALLVRSPVMHCNNRIYTNTWLAYGYEEIIKAHFYLRKEAIFKEIAAWMETYNTNEFATAASKARIEVVSRHMESLAR